MGKDKKRNILKKRKTKTKDPLYYNNLKKIYQKELWREEYIRCRTLMNRNAKLNMYHTVYVVPITRIGTPDWDYIDAIYYLINKLRKKMYFVAYMHPNKLFIYWGPGMDEKAEEQEKIRKLKFLAHENMVSLSSLSL